MYFSVEVEYKYRGPCSPSICFAVPVLYVSPFSLVLCFLLFFLFSFSFVLLLSFSLLSFFPLSFFPSFLLSSLPLSFFSLSFNTQQRTVADLNTNLISEVDTISTEFRNVYELARERAENHANEGWTSKPMQSRLVHENEELRQTIIDTNEKQNELYSDLERKLEEHDETRRTEVMVALKQIWDGRNLLVDSAFQGARTL